MRQRSTLHFARPAWLAAWALVAAFSVHAQIQPPPVDDSAADRGGQTYTASCAHCHAADARGSTMGPDLIRSLPVLHDRARQLHGSELIPLLQKQPDHKFDLTQDQVADLSQFLTRTINRVLRSGHYYDQPSNLLSGDAKAGEAYFHDAGGCGKCHSPTGDLAGIASRFTPAALQQRFVFPQAGAFASRRTTSRPEATVTLTAQGGLKLSGTLVRIDDFDVTLKDASGAFRTIPRSPKVQVRVNDPYAAHVALLDQYTDADIHNLTAYLETLK